MMLARRWGRFCALCAALFLLGGCARAEEDNATVVVEGTKESDTYQFIVAEPGDVELTKRVECTYRQQKEEQVSFALSGREIDKVYVEERDVVKKGQLLAELSAGNLERQIEDLKYRIARNELLLEYAAEDEDLEISQVWVDFIWNRMYDWEVRDKLIEYAQQNGRYRQEDCNDALEVDRQALAQLEQELKYCRVYAGMDGVVYQVKKGLEGSTSRMDETIMTIVDNKQCLFETADQEAAAYFADAETIAMTVTQGDAKGEYVLTPYQISEWGETQQFSIYDGPMTSGIEVGTYGTIYLTLDRRENVLCLPRIAVHSAQDKHYVFVMDEDDVRQIRWVETGLWGDETVEITEGLAAGEKVIR